MYLEIYVCICAHVCNKEKATNLKENMFGGGYLGGFGERKGMG